MYVLDSVVNLVNRVSHIGICVADHYLKENPVLLLLAP